MRVGIAADHAGAPLKAELLGRLAGEGYDLVDLGGDGSDRDDDYPDIARTIGHAVRDGVVDRGILVCGSGVGASVAASKISGIRAAVCHDTYSARQGVEHDAMNILCLGGRVVGIELADACARAFLDATFSGEARHVRRVGKIASIEAEEQARRAT
jgi:ribose 5-phosphate isomerase B